MAKGKIEAITHWKKVIAEQLASGLTIVTFCKKINILKSTYYYWKRRIKNLPGASKASASGKKTRDFLEVRMIDNNSHYKKNTDGSVEIKIGSASIYYTIDTDRELFKEAASVLFEVVR